MAFFRLLPGYKSIRISLSEFDSTPDESRSHCLFYRRHNESKKSQSKGTYRGVETMDAHRSCVDCVGLRWLQRHLKFECTRDVSTFRLDRGSGIRRRNTDISYRRKPVCDEYPNHI